MQIIGSVYTLKQNFEFQQEYHPAQEWTGLKDSYFRN